jgi:hypothetical protein
MRADGSGERQLAERPSPIQIFRVSVADGSLAPLPEVASGDHMSFSPDGSIALDVRAPRTLWAYPMSSGAAYRVFELVDSDVRIDYPVWSPDGRWVLFDRAAPRGADLWALEGS